MSRGAGLALAIAATIAAYAGSVYAIGAAAGLLVRWASEAAR